jgi:hypothetical protein
MANPSNKGIGTGAAQVYDYSRIDRAAENAMKVVGAKQAAIKNDEAVKDKALRELQGDYGAYDTSNIREADKQPLIDSINEGRKLLNGHWADVVNGDPYWTSVYQNQVMQHKKAIGDSATMKTGMAAHYIKANESGSGYSPERIKRYDELALTPGVTVNQLKAEGLWGRDQVIGNMLVKADKAFVDKGNELYKKEDVSNTYADESSYSREEKKWLDDDEALPKFRKAIEGDAELMQDMNIKYSGLPMDEQVENFYNDYKASRINEWKKTDTRAAPPEEPEEEPESGGVSGGVRGAPFKTSKGHGFTLAPNKGQSLIPLNFSVAQTKSRPETIISVRPSEIWKDNNGVWRVRGQFTAPTWQELSPSEREEWEKLSDTEKKAENDYYTWATKNTVVEKVITTVVAADMKAKYGIGNPDDYYNELIGETNSETAKDKGEGVNNSQGSGELD